MMANKLAYKPSVKDIMDKYYEMFRGENQSEANKRLFQQTAPINRTRTQTQMDELD